MTWPAAMPGRSTLAIASLRTRTVPRLAVALLVKNRNVAQVGSRKDLVVLPHEDLDQASSRRSGDVEGRGTDQYFDQPLPFPDLFSPRSEPVAHDDRCVRTGSEVGQDHCRHPHGEPRHVCFLTVDLETGTVRDGSIPRSLHLSLSWPILFGQTDLKSSEPHAGPAGRGTSSEGPESCAPGERTPAPRRRRAATLLQAFPAG